MVAPLGAAQIANTAGVEAGRANGSELIPVPVKFETAVKVILVACAEKPVGSAPVWFVLEPNVPIVRPPTWKVTFPTKFVPVAVNCNCEHPLVVAVEIDTLLIVGIGRLVTTRGRELLVPPPGAGVTTLSLPVCTVERSAAANATWSVVALTNVVEALLPFHCATEFDVNPLPVSVMVAA